MTNTLNGVEVAGSIAGPVTLPVDLPYAGSGLTVQAGGVLTLPAGLIFKLPATGSLWVSGGSLHAEGSAERPVVITS